MGRRDGRESIKQSDIGVTLRLAKPTPDFNGDGSVDSGDFLASGMRFGASRDDERYETKYHLDENGTIGFWGFSNLRSGVRQRRGVTCRSQFSKENT